MATEVVLKLRVEDDQVSVLREEIQALGGDIEVVEDSASKIDTGLKKIGKSSFIFQKLNQLTGGLAGNLVDVYNGLGKVNVSLKATKAALIATGVGAFVVILGTILAYWEEIEEFITGANAQLQKQIDLSRELQETLSFELELLELKEKILETEGKSTEEILRLKRQLLVVLQAENEAELNLLEIQEQRIRNQIQETTLWEGIKSLVTTGSLVSIIGGTEEELEKLKEVTKGIDEARKQALELQLGIAVIDNPEEKKTNKSSTRRKKERKVNPLTGEDLDAEQQAIQEHFAELFELDEINKEQLLERQDIFNERFLTSEEVAQAKRTKNAETEAEARKRIAEAEAQAKVDATFLVADALTATGELIGEQTAAGKALAIAGTLIATYQSAVLAYKSQLEGTGPAGPYLGVAAAAIAVATGLANVKRILSIKVPGGGGGGGASASAPPAFNVVGASPQNQLNQTLLENNAEPVEAFVVEGAVSSAEELRRNKIESSSIG